MDATTLMRSVRVGSTLILNSPGAQSHARQIWIRVPSLKPRNIASSASIHLDAHGLFPEPSQPGFPCC
jgi:hypothetical protein